MGSKDYKKEIYNKLITLGFKTDDILFGDFEYRVESLFEKQYFEKPIVLPSENEIFVDGGCFNCGTSLLFRKWCDQKYEKIYAFEPDKLNYEKCKKIIQLNKLDRIELINAGLWSKKDVLLFNGDKGAGSSFSETGTCSVNVVGLDEILNGKKATFIKMDIEGSELEALKGAKNTIVNYRPRLAICIYHKPEDILEIPLYLQSLVPDYKLYIRHYSNYSDETVLYAV